MEFMFGFKNCVMKIMSKSLNQYLLEVTGKIKTGKENILHIRSFNIFLYSNVVVISRFQW
jgi:hypothetical protein